MHFENNVLAPLLYSENSGNQQCYIMTTKREGKPSVAEAWQGRVCSLHREWHKRQFDTDLYTSWLEIKIFGEDLLERMLPNGGSEETLSRKSVVHGRLCMPILTGTVGKNGLGCALSWLG